jgi:hypothetical protein
MKAAWELRLALTVLALTPAGGFAAIGGFHAPQSVAEKALDRIIARADKDENQLDNLFNRYGPVPVRRRVDYTALLSPALLSAMARHERALVKQDCGGRYRSGEVCGMDSSPITCSQDSAPPYTYKTTATAADMVIIALRWPTEPKTVATYRLKRFAAAWKVDGVDCAEGDRFNF